MAIERVRAAAAALVIAAVLTVPGTLRAQDSMEGMYYGFDVNASVGVSVPNTDEFGNSSYFRGGAGYQINELVTLRLGLAWFQMQVDHGMDAPPTNTIADGDINTVPISLEVQFRTPLPELLGTVYALAGVGYYFIDYSWSGDAKNYFREVEALYGPTAQEISDSFGFNLGAGYEYPFSSQLSFNVEGEYVFLSPEAKGDWRDLITGEHYGFSKDLDMNTWLFSAGFKYFF